MVVPMRNMRTILLAISLAATGACGSDLILPSDPIGEIATMRASSPVSQPGRLGREVNDDPTVVLLDDLGDPVAGTQVEWEVTVGGGEVSSAETVTGPDGRATVTWTLGQGVGVQKMIARVGGAEGSPVTFTATVLF
jgi:hypothetical protein